MFVSADVNRKLAGIFYCIVDDKMWVSPNNINILCEVDYNTKNVIDVKKFSEELFEERYLHGNIMTYKEKIVFQPVQSAKIDIYNIDTGEFESISLTQELGTVENTTEVHFADSFIHNSHLYLIGYKKPVIYKVNLENYEIEQLTTFSREIENSVENYIDKSDFIYFSYGHIIIDDKAFIPITYMNAILELNLITMESKIIKLNLPFERISAIATEDMCNIWITGKGTEYIACWNKKNGDIETYKLPNIDENNINMTEFNQPMFKDGKMYLIPVFTKTFFEIDTKTKEIENLEIFQNEVKCYDHIVNFDRPKLNGDVIGFFSRKYLKYYEYNVKTKECDSVFIELNTDDKKLGEYCNEYIKQVSKKNKTIPEYIIPLLKFINYKNEPSIRENDCKNDNSNSIGKLIFNELCK